jgi:hypothetical protein
MNDMENKKCCVCGKPATNSCCTLTPTTRSYCDECLEKGIVPYGELLSLGLYFDEIDEDIVNSVVIPSLEYWEKSIEEFNYDISEMFLEEMNYHSSGNAIYYEDDDYDSDYYWDPEDN